MKFLLKGKLLLVCAVTALGLLSVDLMSANEAEARDYFSDSDGRSTWWAAGAGFGNASYTVQGWTDHNSSSLYKHENGIQVLVPSYPYTVRIGSNLIYSQGGNQIGSVSQLGWGTHHDNYVLDPSMYLDGGGSNKSISKNNNGTVSVRHQSYAIISTNEGNAHGSYYNFSTSY